MRILALDKTIRIIILLHAVNDKYEDKCLIWATEEMSVELGMLKLNQGARKYRNVSFGSY